MRCSPSTAVLGLPLVYAPFGVSMLLQGRCGQIGRAKDSAHGLG